MYSTRITSKLRPFWHGVHVMATDTVLDFTYITTTYVPIPQLTVSYLLWFAILGLLCELVRLGEDL